MRILLVCLLVLSACGSDDSDNSSDPAPTLIGSWLADGVLCGRMVTLTAEGEFQFLYACEDLDDVNAQITEGTYKANAELTEITYTPKASTCPEIKSKAIKIGSTLSGNKLTLSFSDGALLLTKFTPGGGAGGTFIYGCFTEGEYGEEFVKNELVDLSK